MKQTFTIAILCALTFAVFAQNPQQPLYTVKPGDNLWQLSNVKLNDPTQWEKIVQANPFLSQPGRVFTATDGRTIVLVKPGEQLAGLEAIGILPQVTNLAQLGIAQPSNPAPPATAKWFDGWPWLLLALAMLATLGILSYRKWLRPEQAGPAVVPGGINNTTAPETLRQQAASTFGLPANGIRVLGITAGTATGWAAVGYADRDRQQYLRDRPCYECRFVAEGVDGEQLAYSLQGCANPVRVGRPDVLPGQNFVFTPNRAGSVISFPAEWNAQAPIVANETPVQTDTPTPQIEVTIGKVVEVITSGGAQSGVLTVHFGNDNATVQAGDQTCVVGNVGSDVTIRRDGDAIVFQRGDFQVSVMPDGLKMPDPPKPAKQTLPPTDEPKQLAAAASGD